MKNIPNTALRKAARQAVCWALFPALLFFGFLRSNAVLAAAEASGPIFGNALSDEDMNSNRGSGGTLNQGNVTANQSMTSTSSGNSMTVYGNMTNGHISVGDNFGGSGFGSYVMNSGNNSVINSGVNVSVLMMQ